MHTKYGSSMRGSSMGGDSGDRRTPIRKFKGAAGSDGFQQEEAKMDSTFMSGGAMSSNKYLGT